MFEEFVALRLRRYLSGRLIVHPQWLDRLDVEGSIRIRPDLVFESGGGEATYVADIKYKVTDDGFGREADYYQLLAYTTALELPPEGLLIYCQNDGGTPPREIKVRNRGARLRTWAIRLDRTPHHAEDELRMLADHIAARVGSGMAG